MNEPTPPPTNPRAPFRWSERRVARLSTLIVAGAVVLLDIVLFFVFFRTVAPMLQDLPLYRYMIPAGILAVLLFALRRFLSQLRLFREDL
jgi:hypothetical protein